MIQITYTKKKKIGKKKKLKPIWYINDRIERNLSLTNEEEKRQFIGRHGGIHLLDRTKNGKEKTEITDFNEKWVIKVWDE
jgi:hypothetical protein